MFRGVPSLRSYGAIPEGVSPTGIPARRRSWRFVQAKNRCDPIYPTPTTSGPWKSAHDLIFKRARAPPPEADIYTRSRRASRASRPSPQSAARQELPPHRARPLYKEREDRDTQSRLRPRLSADLWIRVYNRIARMCYRAPTSHIPLRENRRYQLELGASPEKTVVIPNGIDVMRYSVPRIKKDEDFHVGFVGRIVRSRTSRPSSWRPSFVLERIRTRRFHLIGPDDEDPEYAKSASASPPTSRIDDRLEFTAGRRARVLQFPRRRRPHER